MQNFILKSIAFLLVFFSIQSKDFIYKENLSFQKLNENNKVLIDFEFNFEHPANLNQILSDNYLISRSVLESIFISGNCSHIKIESGCGSINPALLEKSKLVNNFPENGVKLFLDKNANFEYLLEPLNDIFKMTKTNIKKSNHFYVNNFDDTKTKSLFDFAQNDFIFAHDPSDFICSDNLEKIIHILPCQGKKGIIASIDQTLLFRTDYIGITQEMIYDERNNNFIYNIKIQAVANLNLLSNYLLVDKQISQCPYFSESNLIFNNDVQKKINLIEYKNYSLKQFLSNTTIELSKNKNKQQNHPIIKSSRFNAGRWFEFQGNLVHEIENLDSKKDVDIIQFEYLIWQFQPQMNKIQFLLNDKPIDRNLVKTKLNIIKDESYLLTFSFSLKPNQKLRTIIPFDKIMKSFENYPHDPQRGHDLISSPVLYRFSDSKEKSYLLTSQNTVLLLPEPDFSMPFDIITYTCVLLGYVYLVIFSVSIMKSY